MKKCRITIVLLMTIILVLNLGTFAYAEPTTVELTSAEREWIKANLGRTFIMGTTPYAGMEYFFENGIEKGYLQEMVNRICLDTGLRIEIRTLNWNDMLPSLKSKAIDIVVGANETADRKTFMAFTEPMRRIPYALFGMKDGEINTLGDIDNRTVAFLEGDNVINMMQNQYKLKYNSIFVKNPDEAFEKMRNGEADAFINSGDELVYELIKNNSDAKLVAQIETITSDMTLSTRLDEKILAEILSKVIANAKKAYLPQILQEAKVQYIRKIIEITTEERKWLENHGEFKAGVIENYLPFDYLHEGRYEGISGKVLTRFAEMLGLRVIPVGGNRNELLKDLYSGEIDALCTAKTQEAEENAIFTIPFFTERDLIYGNTNSPEIFDIYGLEGKRIAIVKDSPNKDLLDKNLSKPDILYTDSVEDSIKAVNTGRADYMIANALVVKYYTEELGVFSLVSKGITNSDSFNYIAFSKNQAVLASLYKKVMPHIMIENETREGYQSVPHKKPLVRNKSLWIIIGSLAALIIGALPVIYFVFMKLLKEKTEKEVFIQKERLLYTDSLTGLYNKNYFNDKMKPEMDQLPFPQAIIILDMNNLKEINDNFGHLAGDISLQVIGEIIKGIGIPCDAFRFGGDEFMVLLFGKEADRAEYIQDRIDVLCENRLIDFPTGEKITLRVASGYSTRADVSCSFEEMFRDADRKMYSDKRYKKNEGRIL